MPGRCWMWPDVPFGRGSLGWKWPDVASCLWSLAPRLAPQDLVSSANVRMTKTEAAWSSSRRYSSPHLTPAALGDGSCQRAASRDGWTRHTEPAALQTKSASTATHLISRRSAPDARYVKHAGASPDHADVSALTAHNGVEGGNWQIIRRR
jgi:hypothetical protein